ncbi:Oxygen-independent coproporphyrinogen-III oxidase 1 [compost metagenome]
MYWRNRSYYGLGAGAHGYMNGQRHVNIKGIQPYIDATKLGLPILEQFEVTPQEAMEDFMMVGLRLLEGVRNQDFMDQFGETIESQFGTTLQGWLTKGLLEQTNDGYRLSKHGILLGNEVFASFLT